ncbi:hypothetical protein E2C01_055616 [Portunus trituberculatus]|uniref:Sushi domain-containing protein n=1 Tax=Portunus trituberculatus TaxID=210409 RepID=A0A5B7GVA0_PORTR|nr:hypothetical protein [Portunus trituberculatus]
MSGSYSNDVSRQNRARTCDYRTSNESSSYRILTDKKSIYQCKNKDWTLVTSPIKCDPPKCGDPPQVPDHGVLTYNDWNQITYQCDTYAIRSGVDSEHKIICKNFTWEELPKSFKCVGSDTYDSHQEWENFLNITLPVSTGNPMQSFM